MLQIGLETALFSDFQVFFFTLFGKTVKSVQKKGVKLHRFYKLVTLYFTVFLTVFRKKFVSTFVPSELRNSFYQKFKII